MKKLYVLIDRNYSPSYRAVQAGHAVAEYLLQTNDSPQWLNKTLIYVLSDYLELDIQVLTEMGEELYPFREPDVMNKITAAACYSDNKVFNRYEMN